MGFVARLAHQIQFVEQADFDCQAYRAAGACTEGLCSRSPLKIHITQRPEPDHDKNKGCSDKMTRKAPKSARIRL
jgi:hypothetical protein